MKSTIQEYTKRIGCHLVRRPKVETIGITSKAGLQWMLEAMKIGELMRRRGVEYCVVQITDSPIGATVELREIIRAQMPKRPEIPMPGFYY
jgi:hypothetical protein